MRLGKHAALDLSSALAAKIDQLEKIKASICAKVEPPFRLLWPRTRRDRKGIVSYKYRRSPQQKYARVSTYQRLQDN